MKILILMAGPHRVKGVDEPATLLSSHGKTVIELLSEKIKTISGKKNVIGIMRESDAKDFHLDNVFKLAFDESCVIPVKGETLGAACSALLAIDHLKEEDSELLVLGGDEIIETDFSEAVDHFRKQSLDAGVISFDSLHPSFSFAIINEENMVEAVSEKNPISKNALVSFWYFKSSNEFVESAKSMIRKNAMVNNHFYISPVLNELILKDKKIGAFRIDQSSYYPLKNEMQVRAYLEKK